MPLSDRLVHRVAIVTPTVIPDTDDYNQPVAGPPVVEVMSGFLYPMSSREQAQVNEAGAFVADHSLILPLREVAPSGYVRRDPDDGDRYDIQAVDRYDFGRDPLVVVRLKRVVTEEPAVMS